MAGTWPAAPRQSGSTGAPSRRRARQEVNCSCGQAWPLRRRHTGIRIDRRGGERLWDRPRSAPGDPPCGGQLGLPGGGSFRKYGEGRLTALSKRAGAGPCHPRPRSCRGRPPLPRVTAWEPRCVGPERAPPASGPQRRLLPAGRTRPPWAGPAAARLAGRGPPGDAALHLQRLGPAFVLVGVFAVLHVLRGRGQAGLSRRAAGTPELRSLRT